MTKTAYKDYVAAHKELKFFSWLTYLPCTDQNGDPVKLTHPVPLVALARDELQRLTARIKKDGFHFADSTLHYIEGYHVANGYCLRALVKTVN